MRITLLTSNQPRHLALIEALAALAEQVYVVQECTTVHPGQVQDFFARSQVMQDYFRRVIAAERALFGVPRYLPANVRQLAIRMGDLSRLPLEALEPALRADLFVVFGASYIRGPLCDALIARRAVNIHMGVSPYYRGSSTNFWALYDRRPQYVGATIHRLSRGLDSGPILLHALPPVRAYDPFALGMAAVQAAQRALARHIAAGDLLDLSPEPQDATRELRYTRNADFTDAVAERYLAELPQPHAIEAALRARRPADYVRACAG